MVRRPVRMLPCLEATYTPTEYTRMACGMDMRITWAAPSSPKAR